VAFDQAAIKKLFAQVVDHALTLGVFDRVAGHEPENSPGTGASYAVWLSGLSPVPRASGLASTTARVEFTGQIFTRMRARPLDDVDPALLTLTCDLMAAYSADLTLGGTVMEVDLLGAYGSPLTARPLYMDFQGTPFRVMEITLPIITADIWSQS
jgi:hypothetical protein